MRETLRGLSFFCFGVLFFRSKSMLKMSMTLMIMMTILFHIVMSEDDDNLSSSRSFSSSSSSMRIFNGALWTGEKLDRSLTPTAYATLSHASDISVENGFTLSLRYRQDESQYATSRNEISYLFSAGAGIPGTGTSISHFAIALPGPNLASEKHLRVYVSSNKVEGEYDFVDINAPISDGSWHHVVVVLRPESWPRPEIFVRNSEDSKADVSTLIPETPWWVCGACAKYTGI